MTPSGVNIRNSFLFFFLIYLIYNVILVSGIKIAKSYVNLRNVDDTSFMAESEEELESLLMKVKEAS